MLIERKHASRIKDVLDDKKSFKRDPWRSKDQGILQVTSTNSTNQKAEKSNNVLANSIFEVCFQI